MPDYQKRIVILGATSAIAEHCARLWVKDRAVDLTLVSRDLGRTERVAADLRVRSPHSVVRVIEANFVDPPAIRQLVDGIVAVGSVAGDRGRKSNYVYGSAKGLVARYAQGLQHRLAGTGVKVVLIKPGPTNTPMTAHLKQQGAPLATVEDVARLIVKGINQGKPVVYAPGKWAFIMMVIKHLPRVVFNRMDI